ncbi:MAG TPA: OmpH family outer membrane protein [Paracoccaceae bacterium]|nr:OmpH family outer membrane protein [Paracoccaceae bacterium]
MSGRAALLAILFAAASTIGAAAQEVSPPADAVRQSGIVTLDVERLFSESLWGKRFAAELEEASRALQAENRKIEAALSAEEKDLTEKRATLPTDEFRKLAEDFDKRVTGIRQAQADKVREIQARPEEERTRFLEATRPIIGEVMTSRGAAAIVDIRAVFLSVRSVDVTDEVIAAIDARLGDGEGIAP